MTGPAGPLFFALDSNLGLDIEKPPWPDFLKEAGIRTEASTDLLRIDEQMRRQEFDIGFVPVADFLRSHVRGDRHYRGLAIATSKFTGTTDLPSVLVVRNDDPATSLDDLGGATYGYINKSCSSSYFPPAILLQKQGRQFDAVLHLVAVKAWQGQVEAVVSRQVRATMLPEDVWRTNPANAANTKVIGRYDNAKAAVVIVRETLDGAVCKKLLDALISWMPEWEGVYGAFRPYYYADVQSFYHDISQLPANI